MVWAASTLVFVLLRLAPGDPYATRFEGLPLPRETRDAWRAQRGLDKPMPAQYARWLSNSLRGELGWSELHQRPVRDVIADLLPRTALLMGLALITSLTLGMWLGAWQGARVGSLGDQVATTFTLVLFSVPEFWLALLLLQLFVQTLGLPATGMVSAMHELLPFGERVQDRLRHLVMPWLALSLVGVSVYARYQRSSMRDAWGEPFVRTARAKGVAERGVRWHAWRTALAPVIALTGLMLPALVTGAVFVERIFAWPGMGNATVSAVNARDYDLVTAAVLLTGAFTVIGSLLADLVQRVVDPRVGS